MEFLIRSVKSEDAAAIVATAASQLPCRQNMTDKSSLMSEILGGAIGGQTFMCDGISKCITDFPQEIEERLLSLGIETRCHIGDSEKHFGQGVTQLTTRGVF